MRNVPTNKKKSEKSLKPFTAHITPQNLKKKPRQQNSQPLLLLVGSLLSPTRIESRDKTTWLEKMLLIEKIMLSSYPGR